MVPVRHSTQHMPSFGAARHGLGRYGSVAALARGNRRGAAVPECAPGAWEARQWSRAIDGTTQADLVPSATNRQNSDWHTGRYRCGATTRFPVASTAAEGCPQDRLVPSVSLRAGGTMQSVHIQAAGLIADRQHCIIVPNEPRELDGYRGNFGCENSISHVRLVEEQSQKRLRCGARRRSF